jgi:copper chaperone CopZ
MIVSFCTGRVRLRFKELKDAAAAALVRARIQETAGITNVEINPCTGSILIEYDPQILPPEKLIETGKAELAKCGIKI